MMHPLLGFWVMQHLCHLNGELPQPTISYTGSAVWNWLCANELLHTEHHDFSRVAWTRLGELRRRAPEFYAAPLYEVRSITRLLWLWLLSRGKRMDFACRGWQHDLDSRFANDKLQKGLTFGARI